MNVCTCFLLFGTFAYIKSSPVTTPTEGERGANLALKNVQETDKTVTGHKNILLPHSAVETFTDFIQEIAITLNTYDDDIFEDFFNILDKKIRKYHYRGCKFFELKGKHEFRSLLAEQLDFLTRKSVSEKRAIINERVNTMKELNLYDRDVQELLDYINFLYKDDAKEKFQQILTDLKGFSAGYGKTRTKDDFVKVINECISVAVFIHTDFKTNDRLELRKLIAKIKEFPSPTTIAFKTTDRKSNTDTVESSDNDSIEDKPPRSSEINPSRTTAHKKEDNKRIRVFRTDTGEVREEEETITRETSERDEGNRQHDTVLMFYMTTEKTGISYKSESKSKLVEQMLEEESAGRLATTTQGLRYAAHVRRRPHS